MRRANVAQLYISHILTKTQTHWLESPWFLSSVPCSTHSCQKIKILCKGLDAEHTHLHPYFQSPEQTRGGQNQAQELNLAEEAPSPCSSFLPP